MSVQQRLKSALIPKRVRHRIYPMRQRLGAVRGVPPTLDRDLLDATVDRVFGSRPRSVVYAPMPGYKGDSVYRLWVGLGPPRYRTLVFKDARLTEDVYPAIRGFPGAPGLPEWAVLSQPAGPLDQYLAKVFAAVEIDRERHYQYLLEDLSTSYRPVLTDRDVSDAVAALAGVHAALVGWGEDHVYQPVVHLGPENADDFLGYVEGALRRFATVETAGVTAAFLARWDEVKAQYLSVEAVSQTRTQLIHGDYNRKNSFLDIGDTRRVKLVDWEWMGRGLPHADLASVLKRSPWGQQRTAVRQFFAADDTLSHKNHWKVYLWCRLQRSLLDAALHAHQNAAGIGTTAADVHEHLDRAAEVMAAMERTPLWGFAGAASRPVATHREAVTTSPRVTIALPVYNGARFLEETIQSILAQTFKSFELIISDNASTDATPEIAKRYAGRDVRVRYRGHAKTVGAHYNFNGLVVGVETDYFKWAADDDLYEPDYLERCVAMLDAHPDAVIAYPQAIDIDVEGRFLIDRPFNCDLTVPSAVDRFRTYLGAGNACLPIFGVHRTKALQATGLLGHYAASDRVLLAELTLHGTWQEIPEPLFLHREHEDRSVYKFPNPRLRGVWFDPDRRRPDNVYWKRFAGYRQAIERAPVSATERTSLYGLLAKWALFRAPDLAGDVMALARGSTTKSQERRTAGE